MDCRPRDRVVSRTARSRASARFIGQMTAEDSTEQVKRPLLEWLLRKYPDTPKKRAKQWITAGRGSVNGGIVRPPNQAMLDPHGGVGLLHRRAPALECGGNRGQIHPPVAVPFLDAALPVVNKGAGLVS